MYQEPVKNFNKIREYIREFYINGFKSRQDYTIKSARSYDNEKRRIESYMNDYIDYHITPSVRFLIYRLIHVSRSIIPYIEYGKQKALRIMISFFTFLY